MKKGNWGDILCLHVRRNNLKRNVKTFTSPIVGENELTFSFNYTVCQLFTNRHINTSGHSWNKSEAQHCTSQIHLLLPYSVWDRKLRCLPPLLLHGQNNTRTLSHTGALWSSHSVFAPQNIAACRQLVILSVEISRVPDNIAHHFHRVLFSDKENTLLCPTASEPGSVFAGSQLCSH